MFILRNEKLNSNLSLGDTAGFFLIRTRLDENFRRQEGGWWSVLVKQEVLDRFW